MTEPLPTPPPANQPVPPAPSAALPAEPGTYRPDELVYVDPDTKTVVGRLEYTRNGTPKSMPVKFSAPSPAAPKGKDDERRRGRKYYPWGTYKSLRNVFKLEGKQKKIENTLTLADILPIALEQAFWDLPVKQEAPKNNL